MSQRQPTNKDLAELGVVLEQPADTPSASSNPLLSSGSMRLTPGLDPSSASDTYAGDVTDDDGPLRDGQWQTMAYVSPAFLLATHNRHVQNGKLKGGIDLYEWQKTLLSEIGAATQTASLHHPYKLALCAANGSGKDYIITAPSVVWLAITNVRALVIITSSSGVQLTAQTENYIKALCEAINEHWGCQIFRIRQRFIKCMLSGSEIRLFATDEAGKAEGYHPLEPNAKMMIVVNEAKSVSEEIFGALRRCTGYTHWLNVSTPGEPQGSFYRACTDKAASWAFKRITAYDCPDHRSEAEIEDDKREFGADSALFRSKNLALFTSIDTESIIPFEVINECLNVPLITAAKWPVRIGFDIAAGGDENAIVATIGNRFKKEIAWQEKDTTRTADRFEIEMAALGIKKDHTHIYADDGGIGHAVIDMLYRRGWTTIKRMRNEARPRNPDLYGNKGAELWYNIKRIAEDKLFNMSGCSQKLRDQLASRRYKKLGGKIKLESKKDAIAEGRHSPDRADAFILSLTGLTINDFVAADMPEVKPNPREKLGQTPDEVAEAYANNHTYAEYEKGQQQLVLGGKRRVFNSLRASINRLPQPALGQYDN